MKPKRNYTKHKHIAAVVTAVVLAALFQTADGLLPRFFGGAALLLIPAVVCLAMFESEFSAIFYGLLAGLLWDTAMLHNNWHAIFLCVLGLAVSALIRRKMRNILAAALVLTSFALIGYLIVHWLFSARNLTALTNFVFPSFVYTLLFTPVFYWLFREIENKWRSRTAISIQ
ncbi:MAG: hypothetical protein FWG82_06350 [Oscillospiraceae bacterium]|nr:hypothetical protein [Oscillospiraceae bacterium]